MLKIRPLNRDSEKETSLVAERMRLTLVDVMGSEKGSSYYSKDWLLKRVRFHIDLGERAEIFLAEDGQEVVAQAIVRVESDPEISDQEFACFSTIYVCPQWRRKGIAKRLVKKVHEWSRSKGLGKVTYSTAKDHNGLIALFEQFGYGVILQSDEMVRLGRDLA